MVIFLVFMARQVLRGNRDGRRRPLVRVHRRCSWCCDCAPPRAFALHLRLWSLPPPPPSVARKVGRVDYGGGRGQLRGALHCRNGVGLVSDHGHGRQRAAAAGTRRKAGARSSRHLFCPACFVSVLSALCFAVLCSFVRCFSALHTCQ
jgi:hypothetical protein